jgi:RHS repeat-associated protein
LPSTIKSEKVFNYDTVFKDQLKRIDYKTNGVLSYQVSFNYDAIGNLLNTVDSRTSYLNTYYTWEGKQLKSIGGYCKSFAYSYNDEGIRVSKKLNGCGQNETINYLLSGDKVLAEINTTNQSKNLYYTYEVDGSLISFTYQGIEYFYIKNIQGDIIKIIDATGLVKVSYQYDAYGNMVITDHSSNNLGTINPYRYRGYRYDEESKLYYLQSRYYNPEIQRFISLDDISYLDPSQSTGLNLYAYTGNNPVMFVDPSGRFLVSTAIAIGFWIGLGVGAIAGGTLLGIYAYNTANENGAEGWELVGWTVLGVIGGTIGGAIIGATLGSLIGWGIGAVWGTASIAGSNGAIALWSGGNGLAFEAAMKFSSVTGAKLVTQTFAGKTLSFASYFMPRALSSYLWGHLSAEFVAGASSATVFLYNSGISSNSTFYNYEIWILLEEGIRRVIEYVF